MKTIKVKPQWEKIADMKAKEMTGTQLGALKRIVEEVKEYRAKPENKIGGNDIDLVENFITRQEEEL